VAEHGAQHIAKNLAQPPRTTNQNSDENCFIGHYKRSKHTPVSDVPKFMQLCQPYMHIGNYVEPFVKDIANNRRNL